MPRLCSRRHFLYSGAFNLGGAAMTHLLMQDGLLAAPAKPELEPVAFDLLPKSPPAPAKANAMISIFLMGGPSHIDLTDYKPKLVELNGQDFPGEIKWDNPAQASRRVMGPAWQFKHYGQCGMHMSELLPHTGAIADDICLLRGMQTDVNNHVPSLRALNTGAGVPGRAALGSWLAYGLGSESQELPAFVVLTDPRGLPQQGGENWSNGPLPSLFQGTMARSTAPHILNLDPPAYLKGSPQQAQLDLLRSLNQKHADERPGESDLSARMASYELAAKMQLTAKEAFDITQETKETLDLYGVNDPATANYGTRCLIARRLIERGVRFVQLWTLGQIWDNHSGILQDLPIRCREVDQPTAALVTDLKRRGLLETTLVHCGGEMGRLPVIQLVPGQALDRVGRDHNTFGFSTWVAGAGFKPGHCYGQTDEFGHHAIEGIINHRDWLATVLHQFGLSREKMVYKRGPRELLLLDDDRGRVVHDILV